MDKVTGIAKRSTSQLISLLQTQTGVNIGKCCSNSAYDHRDRLPRVWSVQKWKWRRDNKDCTLLCLPSFAKPLSTVESSAWKKKNIPGCKFRSTLPRHFPFHAEMYYKSFLNRSPFKDARSNSGSMILLTSLMKREPWNFGCNTSHEYYNWNYYPLSGKRTN